MKAFTQHIAGIVRVGVDADQYGKPWEYAVTYSSADGETCTLLALKGDGMLSPAHCAAIRAELRKQGFKHVKWDRLKPAGKREMDALTGA